MSRHHKSQNVSSSVAASLSAKSLKIASSRAVGFYCHVCFCGCCVLLLFLCSLAFGRSFSYMHITTFRQLDYTAHLNNPRKEKMILIPINCNILLVLVDFRWYRLCTRTKATGFSLQCSLHNAENAIKLHPYTFAYIICFTKIMNSI